MGLTFPALPPGGEILPEEETGIDRPVLWVTDERVAEAGDLWARL